MGLGVGYDINHAHLSLNAFLSLMHTNQVFDTEEYNNILKAYGGAEI